MERYRQGPEFGFSLDSFAHTEVKANREHGTITLISTEARIASNRFLLRTQTWILGAPKPPRVSNVKAYALRFCDKIGAKQCNGLYLYNIMNDRFRSSKNFFHARSWQAWDWSMDYRIEVVDFGRRGHAVVTTRWIDLGAGMKPSDWKRMMDLAQQKPGGDMYYSMSSWSRKRFEALDGPSLDQITAKNAMTLIAFPKELVRRLDRRPRCTSDGTDALEARGYDGRYWKCRDGDIDWWYPAPSRNEIFPTLPGELVNRHDTSVL
ncbi:hypothetical protein V490_06097 [Pseudogymnoascus sp. VKM F-3557]|nr:hypothetical protein V490_06097 [Pseudogymnoascus sp. VKM F-3557]